MSDCSATAEVHIQAGEYSAAVTVQAGALRELRHRERNLIVPFPEGGPIPDFRGIIAAPWPNRIADGRYVFDGAEYEVPVNEPERGCALHGLVFPLDWTLESHTESSVQLSLAGQSPKAALERWGSCFTVPSCLSERWRLPNLISKISFVR